LRESISTQIDVDGLHASRCPSEQYRAVAILVAIRDILIQASVRVPAELTAAISSMAPMLMLLRHGDGGLALFNGSVEGARDVIDRLMIRAIGRERPELASGSFQRLIAGTTLIVQDAGVPPLSEFDDVGHAGTLSFEMSCGAERLIVNCGSATGTMGTALRTTAAHSTLVLNDVNSAEIGPTGMRRRPRHVPCNREEAEGNIWVTVSHDGYQKPFGVIHRRRLYLSAAGDNLRGEDSLLRSAFDAPSIAKYAIRFHLHPDVKTSLVHDGAAILLRLPSGMGWRFHCSGPVPGLAESVYYPDGETGRRNQQIVLTGTMQDANTAVKWALQRITF
jgi:uncharacterized heparinase superfamily protein